MNFLFGWQIYNWNQNWIWNRNLGLVSFTQLLSSFLGCSLETPIYLMGWNCLTRFLLLTVGKLFFNSIDDVIQCNGLELFLCTNFCWYGAPNCWGPLPCNYRRSFASSLGAPYQQKLVQQNNSNQLKWMSIKFLP